MLYKVPAEQGEVYEIPDENVTRTATITDLDLFVETDAGVFESIRYTFDATEGWGYTIAPGAARFDRVLAPGVGFMYLEAGYLTAMGNDFLVRMTHIEWTLVSFSN